MPIPDVDQTLEQWRKQGEELKTQLQAKRESLALQLLDVDKMLAELGVAPPKRPYKPRPRRAVIELPPADDEAPALPDMPPPPPNDATAVALYALRPWWGVIPSTRERKMIELRTQGKLPAEIGRILGVDKTVISNVVYRVRGILQTAREAATKPAEVD